MVDKPTTDIGKKKVLVKKPGVSARVYVGLTAASLVALAAYIILTLQVLTPIQQFPVVGGVWQSDFNATGTADLLIYSVKPSVFGTDFLFLGLTCNNVVVPPTSSGGTTIGKYYRWANYSCNGLSSWKVRVLTIGKHHQRIKFGQITQDIYNDAFVLSDFAKLGKTDCGVVDCYSEVEITNPIDINRNFNQILQNIRFEGMSDKLLDWGIEVTYDKNIPQNNPIFVDTNLQYYKSKSDLNGQKCKDYGYTDYNSDACSFFKTKKSVEGYVDSLKTIKETISLNKNEFKGLALNLVSGQKVLVKIWGKRKAGLDLTPVDWIPLISGYDAKEWVYWWNTNWNSKKPIQICPNTDLNVGQLIWVKQINFSSITVQADLDDVRIVDENTNTELERIVNGTGSSTDGNVFFNMDNMTTKGTCINSTYAMYYNNSSATTPSNTTVTSKDGFENYAIGNFPQGIWKNPVGGGGVTTVTKKNGNNSGHATGTSAYIRADFNLDSIRNYDQNLGDTNHDYNVWVFASQKDVPGSVSWFGNLANDTIDSFNSINFENDGQISDSNSLGVNVLADYDANAWYKIQYTYAFNSTTHKICVYGGTDTNLIKCDTAINQSNRVASGVAWMQLSASGTNGQFFSDDWTFFAPYEINVSLGTAQNNNFATDVNMLAFKQIDANTYLRGGISYIIDFNVHDGDTNMVGLNVDLNINTTRVKGGISILNDGNVAITSGLYCDSNDLARAGYGSTACHYKWTSSTIFDGNEFVVLDVNQSLVDSNTTYSNYAFFLDNNKPITRWDNDTNHLYNTNQTITLTATDSSNNVILTQYRYCQIIVGGSTCTYGNWTTYSTAFSLGSDGDGNYRVDFNSTDKSGQIGDENINYLRIDKTAPVVQRSDLNLGWQYKDQNVQFKITDVFSGCKIVTLSLNDVNSFRTCNGDGNIGLVINVDMNNKVVFYATDNVDNNSALQVFWQAIDELPPIVSIRLPQDGNINYASNIVRFDVNENEATIQTVWVTLNGTYSTTFSLGGSCTAFDTNYYCNYAETLFDTNGTDYNVTVRARSTNPDVNGSHSHNATWLAIPIMTWTNVNENYLTDINGINLYPKAIVDRNVTPVGQNDTNGIFRVTNTSTFPIDIYLDLNMSLPNDSNLVSCTVKYRTTQPGLCWDINASSEAKIVSNLAVGADQNLWWFFDVNLLWINPWDFVVDYQWRPRFTP